MGKTQNGLIKSALASSILFGLIHLINYEDGLLIATSSQVLYTIFIGIILCGVFVKSQYNLWVVILLHAVFDFLTLFLQQEYVYAPVIEQGTVQDLSIAMGLLTVIATLPLCVLGIRYVKQGAKQNNIL